MRTPVLQATPPPRTGIGASRPRACSPQITPHSHLPGNGPNAKPQQQELPDPSIISALEAANLRADNATKALAEGNAANAAQTKALSASLSFALSNSTFAPAPGNFNVDRAPTGTGALFHKMQAKSIKPLPSR
jgi:hypothetical protein